MDLLKSVIRRDIDGDHVDREGNKLMKKTATTDAPRAKAAPAPKPFGKM